MSYSAAIHGLGCLAKNPLINWNSEFDQKGDHYEVCIKQYKYNYAAKLRAVSTYVDYGKFV